MPRENKGPQVWYRKDRKAWGVGEFVGGKRKWLISGLGSREDAQRELARIIIKQDRHTGPSAPDERLIGDVLASYQLEHGPQTLRPDNLINACERLSPFWGDMRVSSITKSECQRYADERREQFRQKKIDRYGPKKVIKPLSNATIRLELATLKAALNHDHAASRLLYVPPIWLPGKPAARERWLTMREAAKLIRAARALPTAKEYLPLFILLGLYTGARKEAILSLRWHQIDWAREQIDFRSGRNQTSKGRAIVPIPRRLLRELKKAKKRGTDIGFVLHQRRRVSACSGSPSCPCKKGGKCEGSWLIERIADVKKSFSSACDLAGIEGVTPHTLRHTCASWMVQKGVPLFDVARYLGHTSTIMVEKTYGHMAPEHLIRAKESYG